MYLRNQQLSSVRTRSRKLGNSSRSTRNRTRIEKLESRQPFASSADLVMLVNAGDELTNFAEATVHFQNFGEAAEQVQFAVNGFNYGKWKPFNAEMGITLKHWNATNWVNARVAYADGSTRFVYDSIGLHKPSISIEDNAQSTNFRDAVVAFRNVDPTAEQVRFAFNGFAYATPIDFSESMTVTLPNWVGTNYVNAEIMYSGQRTKFAWDSIQYVKPTIAISDGMEVVNSREVSVSFQGLASNATHVQFAFNGFDYGELVEVAPTMTVTLPNWEGTNFVNAKLQTADQRVAWTYDSIEYVAPVAVQACDECVTFELQIRDNNGEGFRDANNGDERVAAFVHAMEIWSGSLKAVYPDESITIAASMGPLPDNNPNDDLVPIGGARPNGFYSDVADSKVYAFGSALANHIAMEDRDPHRPEIFAEFEERRNWYFGTDGMVGPGQDDFLTTVLHEIGHGLNFLGTVNSEGAWILGLPGIFGKYLETGSGTRLTDMHPAERAAALTNGDLFWGGAAAIIANDGQRPEMYAPSVFELGSSISHLDESVHGGELMSPQISGPDHAVSAVELGILLDMGWDILS